MSQEDENLDLDLSREKAILEDLVPSMDDLVSEAVLLFLDEKKREREVNQKEKKEKEK